MGVSNAIQSAETQVKRDNWNTRVLSALGAAFFAASTLATAAPTPAVAEQKAANDTSVAQEFAANQTAMTRDQELKQLGAASYAAGKYARENYGIGILIHVGKDIPNKHFASADHFGRAVVNRFKKKYGVDSKYFLRQNDARATGITFHIDDFVHGANNRTEVKNVKEAIDAMTEVVEYLKATKPDRVAQIDPALAEPK